MRGVLERLRAGDVLVGDGAWGTLLMARGLRPGDPPEVFNLSQPEILEEIALQYVDAGADLITTNTFGGSPMRLRQYGLDAQTDDINQRAVRAAKRACGEHALVSASVGPSGQMMKPYGDGDPAETAAGFTRQLRAIVQERPDLICIETMTDLSEAILAVRAAKDSAPDLPVMVTLTFDKTRRGFFTVMGVSIDQAVRGLEAAGADIVGSNCGNGIDIMVDIARQFRGRTALPIAIQSNAGLPEHRAGALV
jgi:5-methyltetrahydrofolate--homocysteine methyltransferase